MGNGPHILVVGGASEDRTRIAGLLRQAGLTDVVSCATVSLAGDDPTQIGLLVLMGPEVVMLCGEAREVPVLANTPILAVVPPMPDDVAAAALAAGADDVVVTPTSASVIGGRARRLSIGDAARRLARELGSFEDAMFEIHEISAASGDGPDALRDTLLVAREAMGFDRASIIAHIEGSDHAYVIAATDDPTLSKFTLAVTDYPEFRRAIDTGKPVLLDDAQSDPLTRAVADALRSADIRAIAIFPVMSKGRPLGAVTFRSSRASVAHVSDRRLQFGSMFANHTAAQLRHGRVMESLRDQTHRISRAWYEAERRLRTIDSLKEHFEAAADGVVILDEEARILFVNRTAEDITGFARDGLVGSPLVDLVPVVQREPLLDVISSVLNEQNLEAFDLDLSTTSGIPICVSVTTSTVLSKSGAVILSFRDVTAQRSLETELTKTKEFLERLIDSTVDAIVAADLRGNVILFNQGAERIYGYDADEVIGHIPVWGLYPEGVPKQVMRMLRSTSYGGVGRLEQTRREILGKSGALVPVNMTASIIYEEGREVATVGIFSDLRERIRIEQRLLQAQEKLMLSEKQALVAELAGAAAHELNQPLTSIIGYTQLIQRQSEKDAPHLRAVGVIFREAERMAEIVKKIGRITKYETTEYVGSARVLDLDKSAAKSSPDLVIPDGEPTRDRSTVRPAADDVDNEENSDDTLDSVELAEVLAADDEPDEDDATSSTDSDEQRTF